MIKTFALALFLTLVSIWPAISRADQPLPKITVFGARPGLAGGAFVPAGTQLRCFAIDNGRCWDGKQWHALFPTGPRKYATPAPDEVTCIVLVDADCWTGAEWYRLPSGQIFGRQPQLLGGAFITAPLKR